MQDSCPCLTHSRRSDSRSRICRDSLISRHAWRPKRSRIPVSGGAYLLWASPGGEQVWLQVDADNYFVGMTPHFAGKSQVSVSVRSILRRPGETFLDGTIRGWVNNETAPIAGILDYPIVVDVPNLATHGRLEIPICVDVQVAAFAREVSTFASEDAYYASREPGGFASRSYVASGTFTPDGAATEPPHAFGIFTGHVLEAAAKRNRKTDAPFYWALVDTLLGTFDVLIDPELLPHPPRAGGILQGSFWFSGTFTTTAPAKRGLLGRLAHKLR
jgi:hypothetical protein